MIYHNDEFKRNFLALPRKTQKKSAKTEQLLLNNPFHPSLRLHKLKGKLAGLWSISVDRRYRIVFKPLSDGEILFVNIGMHAIYE